MVWSILGPRVPVINGSFTARLEKEDDYWSYIRLDPIRTQGWLPDLEGQVVLHKKNHW